LQAEAEKAKKEAALKAAAEEAEAKMFLSKMRKVRQEAALSIQRLVRVFLVKRRNERLSSERLLMASEDAASRRNLPPLPKSNAKSKHNNPKQSAMTLKKIAPVRTPNPLLGTNNRMSLVPTTIFTFASLKEYGKKAAKLASVSIPNHPQESQLVGSTAKKLELPITFKRRGVEIARMMLTDTNKREGDADLERDVPRGSDGKPLKNPLLFPPKLQEDTGTPLADAAAAVKALQDQKLYKEKQQQKKKSNLSGGVSSGRAPSLEQLSREAEEAAAEKAAKEKMTKEAAIARAALAADSDENYYPKQMQRLERRIFKNLSLVGLLCWRKWRNGPQGVSMYKNVQKIVDIDFEQGRQFEFAPTRDELFVMQHLGLDYDDDNVQEIREMRFSVEELASVTFLRFFTGLTDLELNVNRLVNLHGVERLSCLTRLSVKDNIISNIEALRQVQTLKHLHLDFNNIGDASVSALSKLYNLREVSIQNNKLTFVPTLQAPKLLCLDLRGNKITNLPDMSLISTTSLLTLNLSKNKLQGVSGNALSRCQLLQTLDLSHNFIVEPPTPLFLPQLTCLILDCNKIQSLDAWSMEQPKLPQRPQHWSLVLSTKKLRHLPVFLPWLQGLFISQNYLTRLPLSALSTSPLLHEIDASYNYIGLPTDVASLKHLAFLQR
jgi:Leucine-rich repeat (LRR) protein